MSSRSRYSPQSSTFTLRATAVRPTSGRAPARRSNGITGRYRAGDDILVSRHLRRHGRRVTGPLELDRIRAQGRTRFVRGLRPPGAYDRRRSRSRPDRRRTHDRLANRCVFFTRAPQCCRYCRSSTCSSTPMGSAAAKLLTGAGGDAREGCAGDGRRVFQFSVAPPHRRQRPPSARRPMAGGCQVGPSRG